MLLRFPSSCMVVCVREREESEGERGSVIVCSAAQLPLTKGKNSSRLNESVMLYSFQITHDARFFY